MFDTSKNRLVVRIRSLSLRLTVWDAAFTLRVASNFKRLAPLEGVHARALAIALRAREFEDNLLRRFRFFVKHRLRLAAVSRLLSVVSALTCLRRDEDVKRIKNQLYKMSDTIDDVRHQKKRTRRTTTIKTMTKGELDLASTNVGSLWRR